MMEEVYYGYLKKKIQFSQYLQNVGTFLYIKNLKMANDI